MNELLELFPTPEAFNAFWAENYTPLTYEDVREIYEDYVKSVDKHIFLEDYEVNGCISRSDFMDNLTEDAMFAFQDGLTEVFYEKNPDAYEMAFALYELSEMEEKPELNTAVIFDKEYKRLYTEFMLEMFDTFWS